MRLLAHSWRRFNSHGQNNKTFFFWTCCALTSLVTTTTTTCYAFSLDSPKSSSRRNHFVYPVFGLSSNNLLLSKTHCEEAEEEDFVPEMEHSSDYQLMNNPARVTETTSHAMQHITGPGKLESYKVYKSLTKGKELLTAYLKFGHALDGHEQIVHGGIIAFLLDEIFGFAFYAAGAPFAVTANLSIDYRQPLPSNSHVYVRVQLERQEKRKLFFTGQVTSPDGSVLYAEATCLYIIPRTVWEKMQADKTTTE